MTGFFLNDNSKDYSEIEVAVSCKPGLHNTQGVESERSYYTNPIRNFSEYFSKQPDLDYPGKVIKKVDRVSELEA